MIIRDVLVVSASEQQEFGWEGLQRFRDVEYTARHIKKLHDLGAKQNANARKQAEHIRYCVIQATEMFTAAKAVTLVTKPVLLYYSCMHLALAEVLVKQSGESSLDKARENNRHHGLIFASSGSARDLSFEQAAECFRAQRMFADGVAKGTFELWRRSAYHWNIFGEFKRISDTMTTTSIGSILNMKNEALDPKFKSISFFDCIKHLPGLLKSNDLGLDPWYARATLKLAKYEAANEAIVTLTIHPTQQDILSKVMEQIRGKAVHVNYIDAYMGSNGLILHHKLVPDNAVEAFDYPEGVNIKEDEVAFMPSDLGLNEFGYIYVGLFILSNLARYYPDSWIWHVDHDTNLANGARAFIRYAERRIALLSFSELSRRCHILSAR